MKQIDSILKAAKERNELLGQQELFVRKIASATTIDGGEKSDWIGLDRLCKSDAEMFNAVTSASTYELPIGIDENWKIYIQKQYAIEILESRLDAHLVNAEQARNIIIVMAVFLVLAVAARVF